MSSQITQTNDIARLTTYTEVLKPPRFMIPIFKLPLMLYRAGLGWIFGHRFMLLTHIGRRSGKVRRTVLAVLEFDPDTREVKAMSAWSASDWYLNLQAHPAVQVEMGFTRYTPVQSILTPEEIATLFVNYRRKHPIFSRIVCRIPGWRIDSSYEEFVELARTLRGIAFRPTECDGLIHN